MFSRAGAMQDYALFRILIPGGRHTTFGMQSRMSAIDVVRADCPVRSLWRKSDRRSACRPQRRLRAPCRGFGHGGPEQEVAALAGQSGRRVVAADPQVTV